jgi:asparagine synthase (glutamine-hydrolysing)
LDLIAKMPMDLRRETLPFTSGDIPLVPSRMKLELVRTMNEGGERLPYEATQLPPTSHYRAHNLAFLLRSAVERTFSERSLSDWFRSNKQFRTYVDDLLDSAAERPVFDEKTISRLRREHESGDADHIFAISGVTTVELFYRNAIDPV